MGYFSWLTCHDHGDVWIAGDGSNEDVKSGSHKYWDAGSFLDFLGPTKRLFMFFSHDYFSLNEGLAIYMRFGTSSNQVDDSCSDSCATMVRSNSPSFDGIHPCCWSNRRISIFDVHLPC